MSSADVNYVFAHAGGTIPYLANRFTIVDEMAVVDGLAERGTAEASFRRLYWDTALSWTEPVIQTLLSVAGADRIVFGSDYPYLRRDLAVDSVRKISASAALTSDQRGAVLGGNARTLLPRFAQDHR